MTEELWEGIPRREVPWYPTVDYLVGDRDPAWRTQRQTSVEAMILMG